MKVKGRGGLRCCGYSSLSKDSGLSVLPSFPEIRSDSHRVIIRLPCSRKLGSFLKMGVVVAMEVEVYHHLSLQPTSHSVYYGRCEDRQRRKAQFSLVISVPDEPVFSSLSSPLFSPLLWMWNGTRKGFVFSRARQKIECTLL